MNEGIETAYGLRKEGLSFDKIADRLNADGIPTLSGDGKWEGRTIQRKLKEYEHELTIKQLRKDVDNMSLQLQAYQNELSQKDSVINGLTETIESLKKQLANSVPKNPNSFTVETEDGKPENWTLARGTDGKMRAFRKIYGKTVGVYIGKEFTPEIAREKIAEFRTRLKPGVIVLPKRGRKPKAKPGTPSSLCAFPFESRLRVLCPVNRTYRLDVVRAQFPDMERAYFDLEMKSLADQKKIELLHGDPSDCNPDELIRIGDRLFVNFEWRA